MDKDTQGSPAWKAKFTLHGDEENYFEIQTDPKTNEGILTAVKVFIYLFILSKKIGSWKSAIVLYVINDDFIACIHSET